jgi:cytochrome c-type biogenesis protein CcsB
MTTLFFSTSLVLYLLATAAFVALLMGEREAARRVAPVSLAAAFAVDTVGLLSRGSAVLSLQSPHDQIALLAWFLVGVYLVLQSRYRLAVVGALVSPLAFLLTLSATVAYSGEPSLPGGLPTVWLPAHVAPTFLGYAILVVASFVSLLYLVQERQLKSKRAGGRGLSRRMPSLETLDALNYRCVAWGFALFTIGIITGTVLAKVAWGTFWSWEPVQILSILAWLLYALLLQTRSVGWRGRRAATLTLVGFVLLAVAFLSLNFGLSHGGGLG